MYSHALRSIGLAAFFLTLSLADAHGQQRPAEFHAPDDIAFRKATIISEGTRLAAEVFSPKSADGKKLPTIVMSHGWGGTAANLRADAVLFARAGYLVVTFDYRGWGASDSRVILTKPQPSHSADRKFTAEVLEVREVVDPIDQTADILNAVSWVYGEPNCDRERIGLWGSSYSGGHVVFVAARDPRIKALVSQVPALDSRPVALAGEARDTTFNEAAARTHGDLGYPPPGARVIGNLRGAPIRERLMQYAPVEDVPRAKHCAMLFVLAEKEELFDNKDHGLKAFERATGPKKLVVIPKIKHYGIYLEARKQAQQLALDWFDAHLKRSGE
ncbi:MAG TPA: alpha/beta fold hydrolase [Planctomycetaceae bacterium]|jgi:dienelactone hydrolase|nr:alpha/beta fold hydrolase [Planctomycetaceae bacterium]